VDPVRLRALLEGVRSGAIDLDRAADELRRLPFEALGEVAKVGHALATRVAADKAAEVVARVPGALYHEVARAVSVGSPPPSGRGEVAVVAAGTSDLPILEEALVTLAHLGVRGRRIVDVGVAGLGRVVAVTESIRLAQAVIVVAGMEGALPAVVAGLTDRPILAVPTSVGYGVGLGGFVAMLSMLASCSPGVAVVNIDNGFGAAIAAARILRAAEAA
jgi:pyridinium-3,5-biscarboxylic acid mononucleotide synthase